MGRVGLAGRHSLSGTARPAVCGKPDWTEPQAEPRPRQSSPSRIRIRVGTRPSERTRST